MRLTLRNVRTAVQCSSEEMAWLEQYLQFTDKVFTGGRPREHTVYLVNRLTNEMPTGLVPHVRKNAPFPVEIVDTRVNPFRVDEEANLGWVRDYQRSAVEAVVQRGRGILWIATGGGKTEVAIALTQALPGFWTLLVHRSTLVEQAAQRYENRTGLTAARLCEGAPYDRNAVFVCATFQSVLSGLKRSDPDTLAIIRSTHGLIVDEMHSVPAPTFLRCVNSFAHAYYRIGLSGTPLDRTDKKSLHAIGALGPIIYKLRAAELVERGVLATPTVRMVTLAQESFRPTWQGVYGELVVKSKARNAAVIRIVQAAEKPCMVFVKEVRHGIDLTKQLERSGMQAQFVHGTHSVEHRDRAIKDVSKGRLEVLVCSVVFQEGVDIPEVQSVVVASGGKSLIATLQRLGRGMRKTHTKSCFDVWDFQDAGNAWLERHATARRNAYIREGFDVQVGSLSQLVSALSKNQTTIDNHKRKPSEWGGPSEVDH